MDYYRIYHYLCRKCHKFVYQIHGRGLIWFTSWKRKKQLRIWRLVRGWGSYKINFKNWKWILRKQNHIRKDYISSTQFYSCRRYIPRQRLWQWSDKDSNSINLQRQKCNLDRQLCVHWLRLAYKRNYSWQCDLDIDLDIHLCVLWLHLAYKYRGWWK